MSTLDPFQQTSVFPSLTSLMEAQYKRLVPKFAKADGRISPCYSPPNLRVISSINHLLLPPSPISQPAQDQRKSILVSM